MTTSSIKKIVKQRAFAICRFGSIDENFQNWKLATITHKIYSH